MLERYADKVKPEDRDEAIKRAREHEADERAFRLRLEALQSGDVMPECEQCGSEFTPARSDARFCSTQCRVAAHRARKKAGQAETAAEKKAREDSEREAEMYKWLDDFYEDTKLLKYVAPSVGKRNRKRILDWLRWAAEEVEAIDD